MAFAATENAKVWTSVRSRYFDVEVNHPKRRAGPFTEVLERTVGDTRGVDDGCRSFNVHPILSESYNALFPSAQLLLGGFDPLVRFRKTMGHTYCFHSFHFISNSSLARRKIPEYYSCSLTNVGKRRSSAWVEVLCIAVETRATTTGSGALRRFLDGRRRTQEPFLLNQVLGCMERKTVSSTCF